MGWRREASQREEAKRQAVAAFKEKDLPLCGERIGGLFFLIDGDGLYVEGKTGIEAFEIAKQRVVRLVPATDDQVTELFEKHYETIPWAQREKCGECGRIIKDCKCNYHGRD